MSELFRTSGKDGKRNVKPYTTFSNHGGLPALTSQASLVTTPTETQVSRSIGGPTHFDAAPSLHFLNSERSLGKLTTPFVNIYQHNKKTTSSHPETSGRWNVTDENVPVLPECHPLERTAVFVPYTPAPVVAERIAECLKTRSINAQFFAEKKVKAKCLSADCPPVEFRIFLYRGKKTFSHGIIVEVQRRFGFSINYLTDTTAILDAAEDKRSGPEALFLPELVPVANHQDSSEDDSDASPSFEAAKEMLVSPIQSRRQLGLQFFLSQTDPRKIGASKSSVVARRLLSDDCTAAQEVLIELAVSLDESSRGNALSIWTNMFSSLTKKDSALVNTHKGFVAENLIPTLIQDVNDAKQNSRNANTALRFVYIMLKNFSDIFLVSVLGIENLMEILDNAREIGMSQHRSLSMHAQLLSAILERAS